MNKLSSFNNLLKWRYGIVAFVLTGAVASVSLANWNAQHQPVSKPVARLTPSAKPIATGTTPPATTAINSPTMSPEALLPTPLPDLSSPKLKDIAMQLVSSAENSSLNWRAQYAYIQNINDGRGYTGGIIGFTSGTGDMLEVVKRYTKYQPDNALAAFIPALEADNHSDSLDGLGAPFMAAWKASASDPKFQQAQNDERDALYFKPALTQAKKDGLGPLGQFMYYDAVVMHGPGEQPTSFNGIRALAISKAKTPAQGGNEAAYLSTFLDARKKAMRAEAAHYDTSRIDTAQRVFLQQNNLSLTLPLSWKVYGDNFHIYK